MRNAGRWLLALLFVAAGALHFLRPAFYVRIMPPQLASSALALVYVSGFFEIAGGIGLALPRFRRTAGIGLIALLLAVFPANIYMALKPALFADIGSPLALLVRLPLQAVLIAWVWWSSLARPRR